MITFKDLYEASMKEKYSEQLQILPKNFILEVAEYLREKKAMASKDEDFSDVVAKTKKQFENAAIIFKELLLRRRKKILGLVLIASGTEGGISKQDYDSMFDFEKELFDDFMKCIEVTEKKVEKSFSQGSKAVKNETVVFKENVDSFVDIDGEKVGPFDKGDVANIPKEIAKILVDSGKAEVL